MFNKGNMSKLLKQAQAMKDNMQKAQDDLKNMRIESVSNDKLIKIIMDGNKNIHSLTIDQDLFDEDKDFIEDVIIAALNKSMSEVDSEVKQKMKDATGGMMPNIPGF